MRRAWTIDVAVDDDGRPYAILQARAGDNDEDHRYFYARFDGKQWETHEAAQAGGYLYQRENDYTGLAALAPGDPNRLFISTKIDPRSKEMLSHYELFEGVTRDGGSTWQWAPITYNSTVDNLRPIALKWGPGRTALLWLRGSYATYTEYNLRVVGLTEIEPITAEGYSN